MFLFIEFFLDKKYISTNKIFYKLEKSFNYMKIEAKKNGTDINLNNKDILTIFEKINIKPKKNILNDIKLNNFENEFNLIIKRYLKDEKFLNSKFY